MQLVDEARTDGARLKSACAELGIGTNTYRRWKKGGEDGRPQAPKYAPSHALTALEKAMILAVCHESDYASLPPTQIVPVLLDDHAWYIASESSFYRVLAEHNENHRRGNRTTGRVGPPRRHEATGPNQIWCWDVSHLKSTVRGRFFYLYFIVDVFSRKIVGGDVFEEENSDNSGVVLRKALLREGCVTHPPVVHSDNGSAMKGGTLPATFEKLGVTPSYSRPRVSNDNAYIESVFGTAKQRPEYPPEGFESLGGSTGMVIGIHHLVQRRAPSQWHSLRHTGRSPCRAGYRHPGTAPRSTGAGEAEEPGSVVNWYSEL